MGQAGQVEAGAWAGTKSRGAEQRGWMFTECPAGERGAGQPSSAVCQEPVLGAVAAGEGGEGAGRCGDRCSFPFLVPVFMCW